MVTGAAVETLHATSLYLLPLFAESPFDKLYKPLRGLASDPFEIGLQVAYSLLNVVQAIQCGDGFIQSGFVVTEEFPLEKIPVVQI